MDVSFDLVATVLLLAGCIFSPCFYFIFVLPKKRFEGLPGPPLKSYLLGNALEISTEQSLVPQTLLGMALKYGPTFRVFTPLNTFYVVTHPEDVRFVTVTRNYPKDRVFVDCFNDFAPDGLLTQDYREHPVQRAAMSKHFNPKRLSEFTVHVRREVRVLTAKLDAAAEQGQRVNIDNVLVLCLLDTIARVTIGQPLAAQADPSDPIVQAFMVSLEEVYINMVWFPFRRSVPGTQTKLKRQLKLMHGFVRETVEKREQEPNRAETGRALDLLDIFLKLPGATMERTVGSVSMFLFAGHDTTGHSLSFVVFEACRDASLQRRMAEEIDAVMGDLTRDGAEPDRDLVGELTFCNQVWQEGLRMYPAAATGTVRRPDRKDVLPHSRFPVEPSVSLLLPPFVAHRHPDFWDEPLKFRPERFSPKEMNSRRGRERSYFPFSTGTRNCIGNFLANFEGLYLMAALFGRYTLSLDCEPAQVSPYHALTLRPRTFLEDGVIKGLPVKLQRRRFREQ